jgi:hypothetical protein
MLRCAFLPEVSVLRRLGFASLLSVICACVAPQHLAAANAKRVEPGMSPNAVEMAWGKPCERSTTQTAAQRFERWTYCAICPAAQAYLAGPDAPKEASAYGCAKQEIVTFTDGAVSSVDSLHEYE